MNHPHIVIIYYIKLIKPSPRWIITTVYELCANYPQSSCDNNDLQYPIMHQSFYIVHELSVLLLLLVLLLLCLLHVITITYYRYYYYYYYYLLATPLLGMQNDPRLVG